MIGRYLLLAVTMASLSLPVAPVINQQARSVVIVTREKQITTGPGGRILTNYGIWSPDGKWLVYDTRSDATGQNFDGSQIEMANVDTGEVRTLYQSKNGAHCGVATFNPKRNEVVFILGPENPTPDWPYSIAHRQGVIVHLDRPGIAHNLDARDIVPPYTPGALRGGSHVHIFSPDGNWVSFTYNDHVLSAPASLPSNAHSDNHSDSVSVSNKSRELDQRNIGVSVPVRRVVVPKTNRRNHDGDYFSVLVTQTVDHPKPGSNEIQRAFEEGWIGETGYLKADTSRQKRALAFQGEVITKQGAPESEVFVVDIPDDVGAAGELRPLQGTVTTRPSPPLGTLQRRITFTADRKYAGIQGPRHWLRSSPDGAQIAFLLKDDSGVVQLFVVPTNGAGHMRQVTHDGWSITSSFSWNHEGTRIAYAADNSIFTVEVGAGIAHRLTDRAPDPEAPLPIACVYSPDGRRIAFERNLPNPDGKGRSNQIFVVSDLHP